MTTPLNPSLVRRFRNMQPGANERTMITGRRIDENTVTLTGAPEGKCWVRTTDDSRELTAVFGDPSDIDLDVIVDVSPSGEWYIKRLAFQKAVVTKGGSAHVKILPRTGIETITKINGLGFLEGGLSLSPNGGLNVRVNKFWHAGTSQLYDSDTDVSVSSHVPSTADETCWVAIYVDPTTNTAGSAASTPIFGLPQDLEEDDITDIVLPAGVIPCGAFTLTYGQTAVATSRFAERRLFLNSWDSSASGSVGGSVEDIMTTADGELMIDADGYVMTRT